MNKIQYILLTCLILLSCEKEKEDVTIDTQFPDTIELIQTEIKGIVEDDLQHGVSEASIEVNYFDQRISLAKTNANGLFTLDKLPVHAKNSIIIFEKEGFSPNILTRSFSNGEKIELKATLKALKINQSYNGFAQELQLSPEVKLKLNENLVPISNGQKLKSQLIDFSKDPTSMLLAYQSEDGDITPEKMFWIDVQKSDGRSEKWIESASVQLSMNKSKGPFKDYLYYFDFDQALWIKGPNLTLVGDTYVAKITAPGFYASISDCANDSEKPIPYCNTNATVLATYNNQNVVLYGQDFDAGSFDNCDTDLDFQIRRVNDVCMNGSDVFKDSIALCIADIGTSVDVEINVIDDNNNSDYCAVTVNVEGQPCINDHQKPVPYCYSSREVFVNLNPILAAESMNAGSYDNCSSADGLIYKIKKSTDVCQNGSDQLASTITFCSAEIGQNIEATLEVHDENGNHDFCTVTIVVK